MKDDRVLTEVGYIDDYGGTFSTPIWCSEGFFLIPQSVDFQTLYDKGRNSDPQTDFVDDLRQVEGVTEVPVACLNTSKLHREWLRWRHEGSFRVVGRDRKKNVRSRQ